MKKTEKWRNLFNSKWTRLTGTSLAIAGAATGIAFGFVAYNTNDINYSEDYKVQLETTVRIERDVDTYTSEYEIAEQLNDSLEWLGYIEGNVSVVDYNHLMITHEVKSVEHYDNLLTFEAQEALFDEIISVYAALFYKGNVEFRSIVGDQELFTDADNDGWYEFTAPQPPEEEPPAEEPPATNEVESSEEVIEVQEVEAEQETPFGEIDEKPQLIADNGAEVVLEDGEPSIELTPINDYYLNEIKEMMNTLYTMGETDPTQSGYVVWIGYDVLYEIANQIDPGGVEAAGSLYAWAYTDDEGNTLEEPKDVAKPFLISTEYAQPFLSYETTFNIGYNLNQTEANQVAARINYSTEDYSFVIESTTWVSPENDAQEIQIIIILFSVILLLVAFTFTWYFGLLGMINSIVLGTIVVGVMAMITTMSLPLTTGIIVSLAIVLGVSVLISWHSLSKQKDIYQRKETLWNSYKHTTSSIITKNTFLFFILGLFAIGIGLMSAPVSGLGLWLITISILLVYLGVTYVTPFLSMATMSFNGRQKIKNKWNLFLGYKTISFGDGLTKEKFNLSTGKTMKGGLISILAIGVLGLLLFGIFTAAMPNNLNQNGEYYSYYMYEIALVDRYDYEYDSREVVDPDDPNYDPMHQKEYYAAAEEYTDDIEVILQQNGVHVIDSEITKNDENVVFKYLTPDDGWQDTYTYSFTYGIKFTTTTQITADQMMEINDELATVVDVEKYPMFTGGFEFLNTYSASPMVFNTDGTIEGQASPVADETQEIRTEQFMYGILLGFGLVFIFVIIFLGWIGSVSVIGMTLLESLAMFALFPIFWIPFGPTFFIGLMAMVIMSLITKTMVAVDTKQNIAKGKSVEQSVYEATKNGRYKSLAFNGSLVVLFAILAGIFGSTMIPGLVAVVSGFVIIELTEIFVQPKLLTTAHKFSITKKIESHERAIARQKQPDWVEEEYVQEVNY